MKNTLCRIVKRENKSFEKFPLLFEKRKWVKKIRGRPTGSSAATNLSRIKNLY
jgi:hypothetical protein